MISGQGAFVEQNTAAVHVQQGRLSVLSVAVQIAHGLIGVGNVNHLTTVRALQINRHNAMIDRLPLTGQGPKPPTHGTDLHTTASPRSLTTRDL